MAMTDEGVIVLLSATLSLTVIVTFAIVVVLTRRLSLTRRRLRDTTIARDTFLTRDRDVAINASHLLRTPITALRLSLEDLSHWPETAPGVAEELRRSLVEVDRWDEAVGQVLGEAHGHRLASARDLDLAALTADFVRANAPRVRPRDLSHHSTGPVPARVDPGAIDETLELLLDHLVAHGTGPIRVDVEQHPTHLRIRLADTSTRALPPGVLRPGAASLDDSGLARAGVLAESLGGYAAVEDRSTTHFLVLLPAPPDASHGTGTLG